MPNPQILDQFLEQVRNRITTLMTQIIDRNAVNDRLTEALKYTTLAPGKRIRPALVYATGELLKVPQEVCDHIACALEFIHCYSLIHDDLPAMDNDSLRRGRPTCHIQFDEATAILAGDALQALALESLASLPIAQISAEKYQKVLLEFTKTIGPAGLVGGQMFDIEHENKSMPLELIEKTHRLKTGVLIAAAINLTAIISNCNEKEFQALIKLSDAIGVAFQIKDDILDAEQTSEQLGKTANKDAAQNKSTYVSVLGLNGAKEKLKQHLKTADLAFEVFPERDIEHLRGIVHYITSRAY